MTRTGRFVTAARVRAAGNAAMLALALGALLAGGVAHAQRLVWVDTWYGAPAIREQNLNGTGYATFALPAGTLPEALAFDPTSQYFYFADAAWTGAVIHRLNGDLGGSVPIVSGLKSVLGMVVNPANGRMYWTTAANPASPAIMSAKLDGSNVTVVTTLPAGSLPRGIALDATRGKLYVADFDYRAILGCNLDGTALTTLFAFASPSRPWGIGVDPASNFLYWVDYATGQFLRGPATGGASAVIQSGLSNPTDLVLDRPANNAYWVEAGAASRRVGRSSMSGGPVATISTSVNAYGGIVVDNARTTDVAPSDVPVVSVEFGPARPSPSAGAVSFELALPRTVRGSLVVSDVLGREVATLLAGELPAGRRTVAWDARAGGEPAAPGVYFARLRTPGSEWVRRIVVAR